MVILNKLSSFLICLKFYHHDPCPLYKSVQFESVLRIRDILVWIRILRIQANKKLI